MSIRGHCQRRLGDFDLALDFQLPGTGVTGIQGPSGAGKTSLLRFIAGLDRIPGGTLSFNDRTWQDERTFIPPHQRGVGYVFQNNQLFPHLDVRGNIDYAARRAGTRNTATLSEVIDLLGIAPLMGRRTAGLSGGEQRRVAIARTLATNPELLLLDEPLSGLDDARRAAILPWLEALQGSLNIPIVLVSHDTRDVDRLADHLVVMNEGRLVACGPLRATLTDPALPPARAETAATVISARVGGYQSAWQLNTLETSGGMLQMPGPALPDGQAVRIRVAARDVSIALRSPIDTSIINSLQSVIDVVTDIGDGRVLVRLRCGDDHYLAHITRRSAESLALSPGQTVYIQVKSLALVT